MVAEFSSSSIDRKSGLATLHRRASSTARDVTVVGGIGTIATWQRCWPPANERAYFIWRDPTQIDANTPTILRAIGQFV